MTRAVCILTAFAFAFLAPCVRPANGGSIGWPEGQGSVFLQPPNQLNGVASDTEHYYAGIPSWSNAADDVILSQNAAITRLRWWSFYGGPFDPDPQPPAGEELIRIRFYGPRPGDGLPGDILYEESFLNLPRIPTGLQVAVGASPDEYLFEADFTTPFNLAANTTYWVEILQVDDIDSYHNWESAPAMGIGTTAFKSNFFPEWQYIQNTSRSFELLSIPEPTLVGAIVVFTLLFCGRGRYKEGKPR